MKKSLQDWILSFFTGRTLVKLFGFVLILVLIGSSLVALTGAGSKAPGKGKNSKKEEEDKDNPRERALWFERVRRSKDKESAASHLQRAKEQAKKLKVITASTRPSQAGGSIFSKNVFGYGGCDWQEIGPNPLVDPDLGNVSGRVSALALDPNDNTGNTLYVGSAYGGVWETTNALSGSPHYVPISDPTQSLAVGCIALDGSVSPSIIYVGTGEGDMSGDSYYGVGIMKSTNGGANWTLTSTANSPSGPVSLFGLTFCRILVDPKNPQVLLAAAQGTRGYLDNGLTTSTGVYRSTDGGNSWNYVTTGITGTNFAGHPCSDLAYDSSNSTYYAAIRGLGVYRSTNQGNSWTQTTTPFPSGQPGTDSVLFRAALAVQNGTVYVLMSDVNGAPSVLGPGDTGLSQSTNGGQTWTPISLPPGAASDGAFSLGWYNLYLAVPPGGGLVAGAVDVWYAAAANGNSTTWNPLTDWGASVSHADQHAFVALDANNWFIGNDGGVWETSKGASTIGWNNLNTDLRTLQFESVSPDLENAGTFVGGTQDNGTETAIGNGPTWNISLGGDGGYTDTNPANPTQYFAEMYDYSLFVSNDSGSDWNPLTDSNGITDQNGPFYVPYKIIPGNPAQIYLGGEHVWKGDSNGSGWTALGNSLVPDVYGNFITAVEAAPLNNPQVIYASTAEWGGSTRLPSSTPPVFKLFKSTDFNNWTDVTAGLPVQPIADIKVDPTNSSFVYVALQGFGTGHVFFSPDAAAHWIDISGNLPDAPVNSILLDPSNPTNVYVGTDVGVFYLQIEVNVGFNWEQLGSALPDTSIFQIKMAQTTPRAIVAATHGRGVWTICPLDGNPPPCFSASKVETCSGGSGCFTSPTGIAGAPNSPYFYLVDGGTNKIYKFNINLSSAGSPFAPPGGFGLAVRATVDGQDNVYVTDIIKNLVDVFDSNGNFLFSFNGSSSGKAFNNPIGLTVDQKGDLFVVDTTNNRVVGFNVNVGTKTATFLSQVGSPGVTAGQFQQPVGIAVDASGTNLYVSDTTPRVQKFNVTNPASPTYVSNFFVSAGMLDYGLYNSKNATELEVGPDGNIYADVDVNTPLFGSSPVDLHYIQIYDGNGDFLTQLGTSGGPNVAGLCGPAFDNCGDLYVGDSLTSKLEIFQPCSSACSPTTIATAAQISLIIQVKALTSGAQGTQVTDNLAPGTHFVSSSITPASVTGSQVTWNLSSIPAGTTQITLNLSVDNSVALGAQLVNLPLVSVTGGAAAAYVEPFNVVVGATLPTPTFTPTLPPNACVNFSGWTSGTAYSVGQKVVYGTEIYQCLQAHTSESNWMPPAVPALWKDMGPCVGTTPTPSPILCSGVGNWNGNFVSYTVGTLVLYNGELYKCIQAHTSESNWMPPATPALWQDMGPCSGLTPTPTPGLCAGMSLWSANSVSYAVGAKVIFTGSLYQSLQPNISQPALPPNAAPALWQDLGSCGPPPGAVGMGPETLTPTPTATPSPSPTVGRATQVVAAPNCSRNGEPIHFKFNLAQSARVKLTLYNLVGEQVYQEQTWGNSLTWNLESQSHQTVATGLYIYVVQIDDGGSVNLIHGKVLVLR